MERFQDIRRCCILALDGQETRTNALEEIAGIMDGPMSQFMACIKGNDILHASWGGPVFVGDVLQRYPTLSFFLDLKLSDVTPTIINTLERYCAIGSDRLLVTVSLGVAAKALVKLRQKFPNLGIIGMGVPTDMSVMECKWKHMGTPSVVMSRWMNVLFDYCEVNHVSELPIDHLIVSADVIKKASQKWPDLHLITPGIRDRWMTAGDQVRIIGVTEALEAGADYLVLGNQLLTGNPAAGISPAESQSRTALRLEEYFASLEAAEKEASKC